VQTACEVSQVNDELTKTLPPDDDDRSTQPSITAVFELIQNVKQVVDKIAARQDDLERQIQNLKEAVDSIAARQNDLAMQIQNLSARQDAIELQIKNGLTMLGRKIDILNRARLTTEADYSSLLERIEELETKTS
jgi:ABC-type transporter Mla subunit MlaD